VAASHGKLRRAALISVAKLVELIADVCPSVSYQQRNSDDDTP